MNLFICNAKKNEFSVLDFFSKWKNPYKSVNLFTVNNEILNENVIFWVTDNWSRGKLPLEWLPPGLLPSRQLPPRKLSLRKIIPNYCSPHNWPGLFLGPTLLWEIAGFESLWTLWMNRRRVLNSFVDSIDVLYPGEFNYFQKQLPRGALEENVFLEIPQNLQENTWGLQLY